MNLRHVVQEVRELGFRGALFRAGWELKVRTNWAAQRESLQRFSESIPDDVSLRRWPERLFFPTREAVRTVMQDRLPAEHRARLQTVAQEAVQGRILCFSRWSADFGSPIDWRLNPVTGRRWPTT